MNNITLYISACNEENVNRNPLKCIYGNFPEFKINAVIIALINKMLHIKGLIFKNTIDYSVFVLKFEIFMKIHNKLMGVFLRIL